MVRYESLNQIVRNGGHFSQDRLNIIYHSITIIRQNRITQKKSSPFSLDTADTGSGDHENYFVQLNLKDYLTIHKDGLLLNADCELTAVRIRTIGDHQMWPHITGTTLLFSSETKYYSINALDQMMSVDGFYKAIQPRYG